jgi:hypothetical protein
MIINMYINKSDPKKVYKNLQLLRENVTVKVWDDISIENPTLLVKLDSIVPSCNYVYIPTFNRYYFARPQIIEGNKAILSCECDELKSFFDSCRNSPCIARRSTSSPDIRIEDDRVLKLKKPTIIYRKLGAGFTPSNSNNYILTLAGKHVGT